MVEWLCARATIEPAGPQEWALRDVAWQALERIAHRLQSDLARRVVAVAVGHRDWKVPCVGRAHLIEAVNSCVVVLPCEDMAGLAAKVLPLSIDADLRFDHDYVHVLNLLCHIAERGGDNVKSFIADALYPADGQPINTILLQIAPFLGKKVREDAKIREWAHSVTEQIRLQIQRLDPGQQATEVQGGSLKCTFASDSGTVEVKLGSHSDSLDALIHYRHVLRDDDLSDLVMAILDLAEDADNLLPNRSSLLRELAQFSDCLSDELLQTAWRRLLPVARGDFQVSNNVLSDNNDPLNPFRFSVGSPDDVQGMAVYTLAQLVKEKPESSRLSEINYVLQRALTSRSDEVRRMALVALESVPQISEQVFYDVLLATRDPRPEVAASALCALTEKDDLRLTDGQCHSLSYSLLMAARSSDVKLRRGAAHTLSAVIRWFPDHLLKGNLDIQEAVEMLQSDICYSVRCRVSVNTVNE